jgi:hypothetical protein
VGSSGNLRSRHHYQHDIHPSTKLKEKGTGHHDFANPEEDDKCPDKDANQRESSNYIQCIFASSPGKAANQPRSYNCS